MDRSTGTAYCSASSKSPAARCSSSRARSTALFRLEAQGLLATEWGVSDDNRRAKFYRLTAKGRRRLNEQTASWNRLATVMAAALDVQPGKV